MKSKADKYILCDVNTNMQSGYLYECEDKAIVIWYEFFNVMRFHSDLGDTQGSMYCDIKDSGFKLDKQTMYELKKANKKVHNYTTFSKRTLKQVGILALPHNPSGSYFSLLNYIDKSILTKGFKYRIEYHSPSGVVLDNTDRNLCQIMTEGYQGNRLDLMVGNYSVHLVFDNRDLLLGNRYKGSMILSSLNALFNLIRELDQKYYLDVCFERKETLLDEALFISKSNRQSL